MSSDRSLTVRGAMILGHAVRLGACALHPLRARVNQAAFGHVTVIAVVEDALDAEGRSHLSSLGPVEGTVHLSLLDCNLALGSHLVHGHPRQHGSLRLLFLLRCFLLDNHAAHRRRRKAVNFCKGR